MPAAELRGLTKRRQALALSFFVGAQKCLLRHHHFAAHLKCLRQAEPSSSSSAGMADRHAANRADVGRDVFADLPVAARHARHQPRPAACQLGP